MQEECTHDLRAAQVLRQLSARDPTTPPPGGGPPPAGGPGPAPAGARGRVLLLEDEPPIARMLSRLLQRAGFEVEIAGSLRAAEAALAGPPLRLAVLDESLPDGAGSNFIARMRADPRHAGVCVLCCTGNAMPEVTERMRARGAQACLSKPFSPSTFTALVERCLAAEGPPGFEVV